MCYFPLSVACRANARHCNEFCSANVSSPALPTPEFAASGTPDEPQEQQQDDRADRRADDNAYQTDAQVNAKARQKPSADKRSENADDNVADETKAAASDERTCQPTGHSADDEPNEKRFGSHSNLLADVSIGKMP
jgi:hypothetical protein